MARICEIEIGRDAVRRMVLEIDLSRVQAGAFGFGNWRLILFGFFTRLACRTLGCGIKFNHGEE